MKLLNKVAVITGAARGIGRACAERLLAEGCKLVIADNDTERLNATFKELQTGSAPVVAVEADVSRRADVDKAVRAAVEHHGRIDIMINNAGIAITKDFMTVTEDDLERTLAINLKGAFFGVQAAGKQMIAQGTGGVIINMSSINSRMANPFVATYAISKGAMNQLTGVAAVALAPHAIRVVGVGPGTILTDMVTKGFITSESQNKTILSRTPMGRLGKVSEVASVVSFLASDDASYITGQTIYPDGGRLILNYTVPVCEPEID